MAGHVLPAGETHVVSASRARPSMKNAGPGTVIVDGDVVPPGGTWVPRFDFIDEIIVTAPCGEPGELL